MVDKEDGESWNWFLTQLRCCIGSGNKFGTYTIISDRQKVGKNFIEQFSVITFLIISLFSIVVIICECTGLA